MKIINYNFSSVEYSRFWSHWKWVSPKRIGLRDRWDQFFVLCYFLDTIVKCLPSPQKKGYMGRLHIIFPMGCKSFSHLTVVKREAICFFIWFPVGICYMQKIQDCKNLNGQICTIMRQCVKCNGTYFLLHLSVKMTIIASKYFS